MTLRYSYTTPDGKQSISAAPTFCAALRNRNPLDIDNFSEVLDECAALVRTEFQPKGGALNNVRGTWYEWLISIGAIQFCNATEHVRRLLIPLPNVRRLDYTSLYEDSVYFFIQDLKEKTSAYGVNLISSNPDYALIEQSVQIKLPDVSSVTEATLSEIDGKYLELRGKLGFDELVGFASIKTSLRPDRRLQLSHEGALVKAFYEHLKTRLWNSEAAGLKYYGVSQAVGEADKEGLKTVATHSILSVNSVPERAVDDIVEVSSGATLRDFLSTALL
jgi:hypothetical protein